MQKANRGIITASFGDRDISGLIRSIHRYSSLPITVYTDVDHSGEIIYDNIDFRIVKTYWQDHKRYGQRNGDYWQAAGALSCPYDEVLYLDDDMRIVSPDFIQGFELAKHFGLCLPLNPRCLVDIDGTMGADVIGTPEIPFATAYNCGTMFFNRSNSLAIRYLLKWQQIIDDSPQRGPMAAFRAALQTGFSPYTLQYNWCVCSEHIDINKPIILHTGHKDVLEKYLCAHS